MFERFTLEARLVVALADAEARRLGNHQLGTELCCWGFWPKGPARRPEPSRDRG